VVNEAEATRVRRVFELFVETGSGVQTSRRLQAEGVTSRSGRPLDKGDVYEILNLRTYVGEVQHKGNVYPGEHEAIVPRELWDRAHAILQVSPRSRTAQNRQHAPALLKGLIFGVGGRALSPTHCRKKGRLYRYYVAQRVLKGVAAGDGGIVRRVSAAEIKAAVVDQVRALLRQPEVVVGTWLAARAPAPRWPRPATGPTPAECRVRERTNRPYLCRRQVPASATCRARASRSAISGNSSWTGLSGPVRASRWRRSPASSGSAGSRSARRP
jgi:hypothetical protein